MQVWRERKHTLEDWLKPDLCEPVPSGQADAELEGALKGCTAGAEWATVPTAVNSGSLVK